MSECMYNADCEWSQQTHRMWTMQGDSSIIQLEVSPHRHRCVYLSVYGVLGHGEAWPGWAIWMQHMDVSRWCAKDDLRWSAVTVQVDHCRTVQDIAWVLCSYLWNNTNIGVLFWFVSYFIKATSWIVRKPCLWIF